MHLIRLERRTSRAVVTIVALALAALALVVATNSAGASSQDPGARHRATEPLVVRGEATVKDAPCDAGVCLELSGGAFRGTPVGSGAYTGSIRLLVAQTSPNGEGGVCAPIEGRIVLGAGTPDRLVLAVVGDSCQDGAGNPASSSFTGLARFRVEHGTGAYAKAGGSGLATFAEDAADHDHMTLIGRIKR
jgi:hypothetical protein